MVTKFSNFKASIFNTRYKRAYKNLKIWSKNINKSFSKSEIYNQLTELQSTYQQLRSDFNLYTNNPIPIDFNVELYQMCQQSIADFGTNLKKSTEYLPKLKTWNLYEQTWENFRNIIQYLVEYLELLPFTIKLNKLKAQLMTHPATATLLNFVAQNEPILVSAPSVLSYSYFKGLASYIKLQDPILSIFDGISQDQNVINFQKNDIEHIQQAKERIKQQVQNNFAKLFNNQPNPESKLDIVSQHALIRQQFNRKRGHMPIKQLFQKAPKVLTALKPCWMMSPLSVAEYLPAKQYFDLVIFDEASQIKPCEAISSILRGENTIVVGDSKQLPPTTFFDTVNNEDNEDYKYNVTDFESILDVLSSKLNQQMLQWHYRSEDQRLIAFSNVKFYDNNLITFPNTSSNSCLEFHKIPWRQEACLSTNSNSDEVKTVVDLILNHAQNHPNETLGVIGFGIEHARNIEDALHQRLDAINQPDIREFFNDTKNDYTFVRNLERVQGDERDVIILSVGYSKNSRDEMQYRLGPLMKTDSGRRLNVAITRAKKRLILVSCFNHTEMDQAKLSENSGARLLYDYLKYVESGGLELSSDGNPKLNPFEIDVKNRLEKVGLSLCPQYGVAGYFIDFAIRHPEDPQEFILAVEADGATYHSSQSARDRDRLRQKHLEKLGWHFHRIWSTEWFKNPSKEVEKVLGSYHEAVQRCKNKAIKISQLNLN